MRRRTPFRFDDHHVRRDDPLGTSGPPLLTAVTGGCGGLPDETAYLLGRVEGCLRELHAVQCQLDDYVGRCRHTGTPLDEPMIGHLVDATRRVKRQLAGQHRMLLGQGGPARAERITAVGPTLRHGFATVAHVRGALAAYKPLSGAERHGRSADGVERQLLGVLGLPPSGYAVTVTSTGMAGYSLLEGFLLRARPTEGAPALLAPGIDPAVAEQLSTLPSLTVVTADGHSADELATTAVRHHARWVFADPVAHTARQRMTDIPDLVARLRATARTPVTVVVDGTAVSGALPALLPASDGNVEVLYYERGPALQLGLDAGVAGVVAYPVRLRSWFERHRRNAGLAPHRTGLQLFPRYDRDFYQKRMRRSAANALRAATLLSSDPRVTAVGQVCHPGLADHPDAAIAARLGSPGTRVTFAREVSGRAPREALDEVVGRATGTARLAGVDLTDRAAGLSPTLCVVDGIAGAEPFLRLCAGDRDDQVAVAVEALADALAQTG